MLIPPAAAAAPRREEALPIFAQIADSGARRNFAHDRSHGDTHQQVFPTGSALEFPPAVLALAGPQLGLIVEIKERRKILIRKKKDVPPLSSVTAVGTALGDVFFPAETHAAVSTVSRFNQNFNPIYEHVLSRYST